MNFRRTGKLFFSIILLGIFQTALADSESPCDGLLALINRPTNADSPCVVPFKQAMIEAGYSYQKLNTEGTLQDFPQMQFRLGLPADTEINAYLPNYVHQSVIETCQINCV